MSLRDELIEALLFDAAELGPLTNKLAIRKIAVYRRTLQQLADEHGLPKPVISARILNDLYNEAVRDATSILDGHNERVERLVDKALEVTGEDPGRTVLVLEELLHDRAEKQAPVVAITGMYAAYADGLLGFYVNAGVRPLFDFGGHGDAAAKCGICQAIEDRNPHPVERVIAIGTPHHRCAQQWHPVGEIEIPDGYLPGQGGTIGIIGKKTLERRAGGLQQAIDAVLDME